MQRPTRKTAARARSQDGAAPLTDAQIDRLVSALAAARDGDFSVRLRAEGALTEVADAFNALVERNQRVTKELVRISKVVGREGRINERASVAGAPGSWAEKVGAVNELVDNLARPTIEVARVIDAVADGDLRQRMQLQIDGQRVRGEFRRIGTTVNGMVDQLSSFADEVTRVAREVGTEGKLGGQAQVEGVSGVWKDMIDNVNTLANNLTDEVRNIAEVTTAVVLGDLDEAQRRSRAARALEVVADGVVLVDRDDVIRLWNAAATTITGLPEEEVLGRRIEDVVHRWNELSPLIPVASKPGEPVRAETVPVEFGGRELWISGSGVGFEEGTVYAFRDLTEERALEELKADFVATVSHELRTPLAAIYGSAQTIRRTDIELDQEIRDQLLGVIASESDRLAIIVSDLLIAGRLDANQLPLTIEQCDPVELAGAVVEAARTHLPEAIDLELEVPKGVPKVVADPGQLRQVLVNLVDNAIKYSPEGGRVALSVANGDGGIRFTIADAGLGIPSNEHLRIFEKFYRLDPDMTRGIGGTGLGLYICRELVRRMDGKIWVDSKLGEGSSFVVELPAAMEQT